MAINYVTRFEREIEQQYAREATSADLASNKKFNFIDAQTIKVPTVTMSGYKNHSRDGSTNRGTVGNTFEAFTLAHDRDISFYVDEMDVDETNQVLSAANITATFNAEQAIPETDAYRYSKLYTEFVNKGGIVNTEILTEKNVLLIFDQMMEAMDEAGVPESGRLLKVTPKVYTLIKRAEEVQRFINVSGENGINRAVRSLDNITIQSVPSMRMKTAYDYTDGFVPDSDAEQINMIIVHPSAILAPVKVSDVYLWAKGETPESAFGWLYKNRSYQDLFIISTKIAGVAINAYPSGAVAPEILTVPLAKGTTAGTKSGTISPTKGANNSYFYKINGSIPYKDQVLVDGEDGWHAYTAGDDIAAVASDVIVFAEAVTASGKVVNAGKALVTAAVLR